MKRYILLLPFLILGFTSCEDVIQVKLNKQDTDLYAVQAKITTASEPTVFLTKALPVTVDTSYVGISNAVVTLTDDTQPANTVTLVESAKQKGLYVVPAGTEYYGKTKHKYTLTIDIQGVTLTASDSLAPVEKIDSIEVRPSSYGGGRFLGVFTYGQETPGIGNYYKWDIYVNDTLLNKAIVVYSDYLVDGNYVDGAEIFTDFHDPNKPQDSKLKLNDTVFVDQNSISEFAYNFYVGMQTQSQSGSFLFGAPPANIKSNFTSSDGKTVLGLFTAQDVSRSNSVVIDSVLENQLK